MKNPRISQLFAIAALCNTNLHTLPKTTDDAKAAKPAVPEQHEIAKQEVWDYFKTLPFTLKEQIKELLGMGDFDLFAEKAEQNSKHSPFRLFNFAQDRRTPSLPWSLSFESDGYQFREHLQVEWGLCAGVTKLTRRMNMLAHYDLKNKLGQEIPDATKNHEAWIQILKSKVDDIMQLKMVTIPGFDNLHDFSSVPEIKDYLMDQAIELWRDTNINVLQGLKQGILAARKEHLEPEEVDELYTKLEERLNFGYNPIIYLTQHSDDIFAADEQWIHTLQVVSISPKDFDNTFSFEVWDINESAEYALKTVTVDATGHPYFEGRKLGSAELLQWDDLEVATTMITNALEKN